LLSNITPRSFTKSDSTINRSRLICNNNNNNNNNNNILIKFFIIYVSSQQLQGQLQTEHIVCTGIHINDKHNTKKRHKLQASTGERKRINTEKMKTNKNKNEEKCTKNVMTKNCITQEF
jgi:hypothetical protein